MRKCTECNHEMKVDPNALLLSNPPQPAYYCEVCNPKFTIQGIDNACTFKLTPAEIEPELSLFMEGAGLRKLEPLDDLTAIELYRITYWKEYCYVNSDRDVNAMWEKAVELGIERHFI